MPPAEYPSDVVTIGPPRSPNLAVEVRADLTDGTFIVDRDELDGDLLLDWPDWDENGWVNVVCDVNRASVRRGVTRMQGILTRAETGTLELDITDTERRFDPFASLDAIYPNVPIRIRAWGYLSPPVATVSGGDPASSSTLVIDGGGPSASFSDLIDGGAPATGGYWSEILFTGRIDSVVPDYVKDGAPQVAVSASDLIGRLVRHAQDGEETPGLGTGENLLQRVERVLDNAAPFAQLSDDLDYAYAATLAPTTLAGSAWSLITDAADAELGRIWVDRLDRPVVRARNSELTGTVRGTLSDSHEELVAGDVHCCYRDVVARLGTELLTNRAKAQRRVWEEAQATQDRIVAVPARADDIRSQVRYGVHALSSSVMTLELQSDQQVARWVRDLVAAEAQPELRVDSVTPAADNHPEAWPAVAATDIGDRWAFRYQPGVGPPIDRTVGVLGVQHDITPEAWEVAWLTTQAPNVDPFNPDGWFTLNWSELDSDDILAPYGGPADVWDNFGDFDGGDANGPQLDVPIDGGSARPLFNDPPVDGGLA